MSICGSDQILPARFMEKILANWHMAIDKNTLQCRGRLCKKIGKKAKRNIKFEYIES